jgi:hypothetical protein
MSFMVVVDAVGGKITKRQKGFNTRAEADAFVATVIGNYPKAFVVDNPPAFGIDYATVDMDAKTFVYDSVRYDAQKVKDDAQVEIERLERSVTARRVRASLLSDEEKSWVALVEEKIKIERAKL